MHFWVWFPCLVTIFKDPTKGLTASFKTQLATKMGSFQTPVKCPSEMPFHLSWFNCLSRLGSTVFKAFLLWWHSCVLPCMALYYLFWILPRIPFLKKCSSCPNPNNLLQDTAFQLNPTKKEASFELAMWFRCSSVHLQVIIIWISPDTRSGVSPIIESWVCILLNASWKAKGASGL